MLTLIRGGRIVDPEFPEGIRDVVVLDSRIVDIRDHDPKEGDLRSDGFYRQPDGRRIAVDRFIDAGRKIVIPGLVDMQAHLCEPGYEYKETIETGRPLKPDAGRPPAGGLLRFAPCPIPVR